MFHEKIKKIQSVKGKRGLSNIVGSLLMIVLTIVAALLLGHFAFGLFSSNSHNAQVSISDISIINPGGTGLTGGQGVSVALTLTDTGNDPVNITQITIGGVTFTPNTTNHQYITIQPGQSLSLTGTISTTATNTKLSYGTANGNSLTTTSTVNTNTFNVGSTVVIQVTATDIVTNQQLATQATTVVQD